MGFKSVNKFSRHDLRPCILSTGHCMYKELESMQMFFIWSHRTACGILVAQSGAELRPCQWKHPVLTTEPPGNFPRVYFA